jgi:hypothetical protein
MVQTDREWLHRVVSGRSHQIYARANAIVSADLDTAGQNLEFRRGAHFRDFCDS